MIIRTFEDKFGNVFTDIELEIHRGAVRTVQEDSVSVGAGYAISRGPTTKAVYYTVCFWVTAEAKAANKDSMLFSYEGAEGGNTESFAFDLDEEIYAGLSLRAACEKHFINCVFPEGRPAGNYRYP